MVILPNQKSESRAVIVIPARMASGRLPGKPLLEAGGKPLVHHVYDRAKRTVACRVVVTSPDREVCRYCDANGMAWFPSRPDCPSGTHRVAEVAARFKLDANVGLVVNWQVDEPMLDPADVDGLIRKHVLGYHREAVTITAPIDEGQARDENTTKAIELADGRVQWFSRAPMRGAVGHCGIYTFWLSMLLTLGNLRPSRHSEAEGLEQLTWLENGYAVRAHRIESLPPSINTEEDFRTWKRLVED